MEYQCFVYFVLVEEMWVMPHSLTAPNQRMAAERAVHTVKRTLVPETEVQKVEVVESENVNSFELSDIGASPHVV